MLTSKEIAHLAVKALDDKLARDIQILKTDKVTVLADYFILCTAGNSTHGGMSYDQWNTPSTHLWFRAHMVLDGIVLRRQAEGVITDGEKNVVALHPLAKDRL